MSRIYTQLDENDELYRMAIVFYLTMRGIPQIYYGTEVLMSHPGTESHGAIRAEFPGGWSDHAKNAVTGEGMSDKELEAQQFMRKLLQWRKNADVIHNGELMQYAPIGSVYTYFRYDERDTVMVVFNRGDKTASIRTDRFSERIDPGAKATDVISGQNFDLSSEFEIAPRSVLLLEIEE
jgi:glycosidase